MSIRQQRINNKKNQIEISKILFNLIYKEKIFRKKNKITKFKLYKLNGQFRFDCYFENKNYIILIIRADSSIKVFFNSPLFKEKYIFKNKYKSNNQFIRIIFKKIENYLNNNNNNNNNTINKNFMCCDYYKEFYKKCFQYSFKLFFEENSNINLIQFDRKNAYAKNIFWVRHKNNYSYQVKNFNKDAIYFEEGILGNLERSYSVNTFYTSKELINNLAYFKRISSEYIIKFLINK